MVRKLENLNHYFYNLEKQKIKPLANFLDKFPIGESIRKNFEYSVNRIKDFQKEINEKLKDRPEIFSVILIGSYGRLEASELSDVDFLIVFKKKKMKKENKEQIKNIVIDYFKNNKMFDKVSCFSCLDLNELTHNIGGSDDSNDNLTSRILLILESIPIHNEKFYNEVLNSLFNHYLEECLGNNNKFPQFLINEIMRYWRTLCIDYRYKKTEADKSFTIRVLKLRIFRKIEILSSILILIVNKGKKIENIGDLMFQMCLPSFARLNYFFTKFPIENEILNDLFNYYNSFMNEINKENIRNELNKVDFDFREKDPLYCSLRENGRSIHKNIKKILEHESIREHIFDIFL